MKQNTTEVFELNSQYSTTRCVTRTSPVIVNKPEDKITSVLFLPEHLERKAEGGLRTQGLFKYNQENKPLISVITVVFNGAQYLEQTIKSVIEQTYDNVEYIIIDGGSTDGTLDIIKQYEGQIDYWVSEADEGIYNAMNKGLSTATGEYLNFMNAGDWFVDKYTILSIDFINTRAGLIYGNHEIRYSTINKSIKAKSISEIYKGMIFCHQSMFISRKIHREFPYNYKEYKVSADFNLIFNYIVPHEHSLYYMDSVLSSIEAKGESNKNIFLTIREYKNIVLTRTNFFRIKFYYIMRFADAFIRESIKAILPEIVIDIVRKKI